MKRRGLNIASIITMSILGISNLITGITESRPFYQWFIYVGMFLAAACLIFIFEKYITPKIMALFFILLSVLSIILGDNGNLTGATFLIFSIYIFESKKVSLIALALTFVVILIKSVWSGFTVPQTMNYLLGYGYILSIYFLLIHPKPLRSISSEIDYETAEVIKMVISGLSYKEIADRLTISTSAVSKKLERCRARFNAKSNEHLVALLVSKGHIVL